MSLYSCRIISVCICLYLCLYLSVSVCKQISCGAILLLDLSQKGSQATISHTGATFAPVLIRGDTWISIFSARSANKTKGAREKIPDFFVQFHTAFVTGCTMTFDTHHLDFVAQSQDSFSNTLKLVA